MQKPVVAGWNKPTREYYDVPNARQSKPLSRIISHGACALILAVVLGWAVHACSVGSSHFLADRIISTQFFCV